ncbi:MAG: hypothetical protein MZV65_44710 [Chromatiales bacterium]|nr:hypothetical protein [Chromatiales bacterium]
MKSRLIPMAIALASGFGLGAQAAPVTYDDIALVLLARAASCATTARRAARPAARQLRCTCQGRRARAGGPQRRCRRVGTDPPPDGQQSQPRMPMTGPPFLSDAEVALFERWVGGGMQRGGAKASAGRRQPRAFAGPGEAVTYAHGAPILSATRCAKCHTDNGEHGTTAPEGPAADVLRSDAGRLPSGLRVVPGQRRGERTGAPRPRPGAAAHAFRRPALAERRETSG